MVLGYHQRFYGHTVILCKQPATELHQLEPAFCLKFLAEMSLVAEALWNPFQLDELNYELLGAGKVCICTGKVSTVEQLIRQIRSRYGSLVHKH